MLTLDPFRISGKHRREIPESESVILSEPLSRAARVQAMCQDSGIVDGEGTMLRLLNYLRLPRRGRRILADRRRFMRECMSVALNTIGASFAGQKTPTHLTAGLEPGSSAYARLHIQFEARFPRESCVEPLGTRVPAFIRNGIKLYLHAHRLGFPGSRYST